MSTMLTERITELTLYVLSVLTHGYVVLNRLILEVLVKWLKNNGKQFSIDDTELTFIRVETTSNDPTTKSTGAMTMRGSKEYPITPRTWP